VPLQVEGDPVDRLLVGKVVHLLEEGDPQPFDIIVDFTREAIIGDPDEIFDCRDECAYA
jgi:hypothetical protein